jgi:hypothetical protein
VKEVADVPDGRPNKRDRERGLTNVCVCCEHQLFNEKEEVTERIDLAREREGASSSV